MPDVIDLSTYKSRDKTDDRLSFEDLSEDEQEAVRKMAENNNGEVPETPALPVTTAFLVIVEHDGTVAVVPNFEQAPAVDQDRTATADDIYGALAVIQKNIQTQQAAQMTQMAMMQIGAAMQQQAQEAKIRKDLHLPT